MLFGCLITGFFIYFQISKGKCSFFIMDIPLSQNILKQISPSADETFTVCAREESANRILKHHFDERIDVQLLWEIRRRENIDKKNQVNYLIALYTKQSFKKKDKFNG